MGFIKKLFGSSEEKPQIIKRTLMNIQVNDIVMYYEKDYQVFAVIEWMQEGFSWKEYRLKDQNEVFWISAEVDDGEIVAGFYTMVKDLKITAPYPESFEYQGILFKLEEKGKAVGKMTSEAGSQNYQCNFYEYLSEDEKKYFSIEHFGGEVEMSFGENLKQSEINILPGG